MKTDGRDRVEVVVPATTILRLLVAALLVFIALKLWTPFLLLFIAVLLAITFEPFVALMERHGVRRALGVAVVTVLFLICLLLFFAFLLPMMSDELSQVIRQLPLLRKRAEAAFPATAPFLERLFEKSGARPDTTLVLQQSVVFGKFAFEALAGFLFIVVLTIYLLLEGKQLYAWLVSYIPRHQRGRMRETANEVSRVVMSYMRGQLITSALCGGFAFVILLALGVPAPLPLAFFAAICDVIPVVGTILMTAPAVMLALTISPGRAAAVLVAYFSYHLIENYIIVPRVYGRQLRLSTLSVLLSLAVGATLAGVAGALLALPIAAAYPIIERIWLRNYLSDEVLEDHKALDQEESDKAKEAADDVLRGTPPSETPGV